MSAQTILLVNGEPLGRERVNHVKNYVPIKLSCSAAASKEKVTQKCSSPHFLTVGYF